MAVSTFVKHTNELWPCWDGSILATTSTQIDASAEEVGVTFSVPKTGTLKSAIFGFSAASFTLNAASVLRASWRGMSGGILSNTETYYRALATNPTSGQIYTALGIITDDGTDTGNKLAVTHGSLMGFALRYTTFTAADLVRLAVYSTATWQQYGIIGLNTAGSFVNDLGTALLILKYDDDSLCMPEGCWWTNSTGTSTAFNNTTDPKERGIYFVPAVPVRIGGIRLYIDSDNAFDIVLYTGTTETDVFTVNNAVRSGTAAQLMRINLDTTWSLAANTAYRIHVRPTSASNVGFRHQVAADATHLAAMTDIGTVYHSQRSSADVYSEDDTIMPAMSLMACGFDDGASGSGGLKTHPGMDGGFRG